MLKLCRSSLIGRINLFLKSSAQKKKLFADAVANQLNPMVTAKPFYCVIFRYWVEKHLLKSHLHADGARIARAIQRHRKKQIGMTEKVRIQKPMKNIFYSHLLTAPLLMLA